MGFYSRKTLKIWLLTSDGVVIKSGAVYKWIGYDIMMDSAWEDWTLILIYVYLDNTKSWLLKSKMLSF